MQNRWNPAGRSTAAGDDQRTTWPDLPLTQQGSATSAYFDSVPMMRRASPTADGAHYCSHRSKTCGPRCAVTPDASRPLGHGSGHGVAAWMRCGDGGLRSSRKAGRIGRGHKLPPQLGHMLEKWPSTQRRPKVHSKVQIIASVDAGGRSTSQHSQLGRSSSTPQVYLMMTAGTPQPRSSFIGSAPRPYGQALSASAADVPQPMRGLNLVLGVRRDALPHSRKALTVRPGSESSKGRKALVCRPFVLLAEWTYSRRARFLQLVKAQSIIGVGWCGRPNRAPTESSRRPAPGIRRVSCTSSA